MRPRSCYLVGLLTALLVVGSYSVQVAELSAQDSGTVVYLVRHAEKADDGTDDPPLTSEGAVRANALVHVLQDAGIDRVFSTGYKRAWDTAKPLADHLGLRVEEYDPSDLEGFAKQLRASSGRHLVSGHSNTTPALVAFLGGEPGTEIYEPTEYDRLYVLTLSSDAPTVTTLLRFGKRSPVP